MHGRINNLTGKVFGRLTVLHYAEGISGHGAHWVCKCECGTVKTLKGCAISSGHVNSCGCLKNEYLMGFNRKKRYPGDGASFSALYSRYKSTAKKKGLKFDLNKSEFRRLTSDVCHYCGRVPGQVATHKHMLSTYTYNGVDRLDNTIGYHIDNCVTCCKTCNTMKMALTEDEFYEHILRIVENKCLVKEVK